MSGWLLLRNESAGTDDVEVVTAVAGRLAQHGPTEVVATDDADAVDEALRAADGRAVVVCGGDGSVQLSVERARALSLLDELRFGVLPLGTGNDLAGALSLPTEPEQVVAALTTADPRPMDLLVTEQDRVVVNAVHVGVGVAAAERATDLKESVGALAYPLGAVTAGVSAQGLDVEVVLDGERVDLRQPALMVIVANGRTIGGGTVVAPTAVPDDGALDVIVSHAVDPAQRVAFATAMVRGNHLDRDDVVFATGTEVTISGSGLAHNRDGELEEASGATRSYRVEPGAWRLLA